MRARIRKDGLWISLPALRSRASSSASTSPRARLDVHIRSSGEALTLPRDDAGLGHLVGWLHAPAPALVVLGHRGFEVSVAAALAGAGLPLAVVNSRQVRDFARATGRLAKTDRLDAVAIALFAERVRPAPRPVA